MPSKPARKFCLASGAWKQNGLQIQDMCDMIHLPCPILEILIDGKGCGVQNHSLNGLATNSWGTVEVV
jgi:hypothetical protein